MSHFLTYSGLYPLSCLPPPLLEYKLHEGRNICLFLFTHVANTVSGISLALNVYLLHE